MVQRSDGRVVGSCGFTEWLPRHACAEVAYALARPLWRRGLMTEAVRPVLEVAFGPMACNRVQARCEPENAASPRVMEKAGMRFEGVLREHLWVKGRYRDLRLWSLLAREFRAG